MRRLYLSDSHSKGQWFLISTIAVSSTLLAISILFSQYFTVDATTSARMDEDFYFWNIKGSLEETVQLNGFDQPGCTVLNSKLDEFTSFAQKRMSNMGYFLFVNRSVICASSQATFGILLASEKMIVYENVNPNDVIPGIIS